MRLSFGVSPSSVSRSHVKCANLVFSPAAVVLVRPPFFSSFSEDCILFVACGVGWCLFGVAVALMCQSMVINPTLSRLALVYVLSPPIIVSTFGVVITSSICIRVVMLHP